MSSADRRTAGFLAGICGAALIVQCALFGVSQISAAGTVMAAENAERENRYGENGNIRTLYEEYNARFAAVEHREDIAKNGFETVDVHIFPVQYLSLIHI